MLTGWRLSLSKFFIIPHRVIFSIMGFLAIFNAYTMRICLSVAIVQMTKKLNATAHAPDVLVCPKDDEPHTQQDSLNLAEYEWSQSTQGFILSSFYIGYIITHIPGGYLAERYGGKWVLGLGILSTAFFTIITPFVTKTLGEWGLIILRILMGAGEGTTFPALSVLLASWVPLKERATLGSFVMGGGQIGTVIGTALSGYLIKETQSWASVFYFFGAIGILWFLIFILICYNSPQQHPFVTDSERQYLQKEITKQEGIKNLSDVPWKAILTSMPIISLVLAQIGHDWGFYVMVTDLPKYMNDVLNYSIESNGLLSSVPYLVMWIVSFSSGFLCDFFIRKNFMSITNARKFFTAVAAVGPAIFLILASYAGCNRTVVVLHFTIAMGLMGTYYPGMKINALDLAPNYAGILMAIINGIGAITGVLSPSLAGLLTPNATLQEWRTVFWVSFVIFIVTSIFYIFGASGEIQPWDDQEKYRESENAKKDFKK